MRAYDVIIAGYGPTGAVAANLLGARGLAVLVVDPAESIFDIPRAVHFDGEVMRIFQSLGLTEEIQAVGAEGTELTFVNARGDTLLYQNMENVPRLNHWPNDIFFNQPALERVLRDGVTRYANVEVDLGWALGDFTQSSEGVEATLHWEGTGESQLEGGGEGQGAGQGEELIQGETERRVRSRYLLAADGASSPARKRLGISQEDLECDDPWLVVDWLLEEGTSFNRGVYQFCDPARPATLVPCEGTHIRWEFMLNPGDEIEELEDEATVRALMAPYVHHLSPEIDPQAGELIRSKVYNFHALIADRFQSDRVFVLGDAVHQMPPFLGQGMCAGMRDADNLAWKLAGVLREEFGPSLLESYTTERRPHARRVVQTAVKIGAIIQTRNRLKAFVRDWMLFLGERFPSFFPRPSMAFGWSLGEGCFACEGAPKPESPIGQPMPQAKLRRADGAEVLSDDLLGGAFSVVGFESDPAEILAKASPPAGPRLQSLYLGPTGIADHRGTALEAWAKKNEICFALVRPDRQVFSVSGSSDTAEDDLLQMLKRLDRKTSRESA